MELENKELFKLFIEQFTGYEYVLLQLIQISVLFKKNEIMTSKTLTSNCNCIHCKQKLEQINRSKVYWDKLIINKLNA